MLGQLVASCRTTLDVYVAEVFLKYKFLEFFHRLERNLYNLGLSVAIGREPGDFRLRRAHSEVVLAVACDTWHIKSLYIGDACGSILVCGVVYGSRVVLLEHCHMDYFHLSLLGLAALCLSYKHFVGHLDYLICAIFVEDDYVINIGTVAHKLVFLERGANEAFCTIDVEFLIGLGHSSRLDGVEVAYLCETRMLCSIFLL